MSKSISKMFSGGFFHWFFQRTSAFLLLFGLVVVVVTDSFSFGFIGILILLFHFEAGLHTVIADYMHDSNAKLISNTAIDLVLICLAKTAFIVFTCF